MICPTCGKDRFVSRPVPFRYGNVSLGEFDADICRACGEVLFTEEASDAIDVEAKRLGLWGKPPPMRVRKMGL